MGIIAWLVLGGLAGWIASMFAGTNSQMGLIRNIIVGIIGAFLGGMVFTYFGKSGVTGFNLWSLLVATTGAFIFLALIKLISGKK